MINGTIERNKVGSRIVTDAIVTAFWKAERSSAIGIQTHGTLPITMVGPRAPLDEDMTDGERLAIKRSRRSDSLFGLVVYGFDAPLPMNSLHEAVATMNQFKACGLRMTITVPDSFVEDGIEFVDSLPKANLNGRDALAVKRFAREGKAALVIQYIDGSESMVLGLDNPVYAGPHSTELRKSPAVRRAICVMPPVVSGVI